MEIVYYRAIASVLSVDPNQYTPEEVCSFAETYQLGEFISYEKELIEVLNDKDEVETVLLIHASYLQRVKDEKELVDQVLVKIEQSNQKLIDGYPGACITNYGISKQRFEIPFLPINTRQAPQHVSLNFT